VIYKTIGRRRHIEKDTLNNALNNVIYKTMGRRRPYKMVYGFNHCAGQLAET
jgi:hypothetical protein